MTESTKLTSRRSSLKCAALSIFFCVVASLFFATSIKSAPKFSPLPEPTPAKKPAASAPNKTAAKPAATPAAGAQKVIVNTTSARVRSEASTASSELKRLKLGTVLSVVDKTKGAAPWYKVQMPAGSKVSSGWMSSTVVSEFDPGKAETIYTQLTTKNLKKTGMSFTDSAEVYEFLAGVVPDVKNGPLAAELGLKKFQALASALDAIPIMKADNAPYKDFTATHDEEIVYSEPAGQYFVRADKIWDLRKKHAKSPLADEIAWAAARTNLPGECEGYVPCYLYLFRETDGEYLNLHPFGKHAPEALKNLITYLQPIVADLKEKKIYDGPTDLSDRAEYTRHLADLRTIASKLALVDKDKLLRQINQLAEAYR
jgi:Bacterial SH3 domain